VLLEQKGGDACNNAGLVPSDDGDGGELFHAKSGHGLHELKKNSIFRRPCVNRKIRERGEGWKFPPIPQKACQFLAKDVKAWQFFHIAKAGLRFGGVFALRGLESLRNTSTKFQNWKFASTREQSRVPVCFADRAPLGCGPWLEKCAGRAFTLFRQWQGRFESGKMLGFNKPAHRENKHETTGKIIGRLIVGCVFACCLTSNVYSQITQGASSAPLTAEQIAPSAHRRSGKWRMP